MPYAQAPRGKQSADLIGVVPLRLADNRRAAFEGYLSEAITRFGVPGAAVAVIQDGEVTYLRGFGVKELGGTQPVTPDTLFMIGSITKPMTTMLGAAIVGASHVDPAAVAPYLGRYTQPTLGEVRITWRRDRLVLRGAPGILMG
jgi:CubicO group peptidase (beta-lactamase class C family)